MRKSTTYSLILNWKKSFHLSLLRLLKNPFNASFVRKYVSQKEGSLVIKIPNMPTNYQNKMKILADYTY